MLPCRCTAHAVTAEYLQSAGNALQACYYSAYAVTAGHLQSASNASLPTYLHLRFWCLCRVWCLKATLPLCCCSLITLNGGHCQHTGHLSEVGRGWMTEPSTCTSTCCQCKFSLAFFGSTGCSNIHCVKSLQEK